MRSKRAELERSLNGCFGPHQRFLVARQLAHIDSLDALIDEVLGLTRIFLVNGNALRGSARRCILSESETEQHQEDE